MKSSTTIAEQLGHVRYFDLLQRYYDAMSDAIIDHRGEVYQYIGDEVVITWRAEVGLENDRCVRCYLALKESLRTQAAAFERDFGVTPDFKAGLHLGEVTTGEIGALKKEIVYTGDVLNATARLQGLCKEYGTDLLVSEDLVHRLSAKRDWSFEPLGTAALRGRKQEMKVYGLRPTAHGRRLTAHGRRLTMDGLRQTAHDGRLTADGLRWTAYGRRYGVCGWLLHWICSRNLHSSFIIYHHFPLYPPLLRVQVHTRFSLLIDEGIA